MDALEEGEIPMHNGNYDVVNMDIESSGSDVDDEAEKLREILIKQMEKKRSTKPATPRPLTPKLIVPPSFRPPLSPPGFNSLAYSLPPPPIPPQIYSDIGNVENMEFYADNIYEPSLCASTSNLEVADTPRSPDESILNVLQLVNSSDDSSDEPAYEIDLDNAKKDSKGRKREIDRLFKRQKVNEEEYKNLKSSIEQAKKELNEMEKKLLQHVEKGMEITKRIQSNLDRYFVSDNKQFDQINVERARWKTKLTQRSARSKERIRTLKESAAIVMSQPYSRPKIIPLNPITTPSPRTMQDPLTTFDRTPKISDYAASKVEPIIPSLEKNNKHEKYSKSSKEEHKRSKRKDSKSRKSSKSADKRLDKVVDKSLDKVADQLSISQIVGDKKKDANEVEAELLTRILERERKKQRSHNHKSEKRKRSKQSDEVDGVKEKVENNEQVEDVEDPVQHTQQPESSLLYSNCDSNFPKSSRFVSLESASQNPLIGISAYRTSPSFPFEHINNLSISNRINPEVALCPFELHGICADTECNWQHDRDFRLSDQEIIRDILNFWPSLCPPGVSSDDLAQKLLSSNSVEYVARMLSSAIPAQIRDQCFSKELKQMITKSTEEQ